MTEADFKNQIKQTEKGGRGWELENAACFMDRFLQGPWLGQVQLVP